MAPRHPFLTFGDQLVGLVGISARAEPILPICLLRRRNRERLSEIPAIVKYSGTYYPISYFDFAAYGGCLHSYDIY